MKNKNNTFRGLLLGYFIASIALFLYSYTQVDLNLTLSRVSIWQSIQKSFQYIGYYQRPLSTALYLGLLALFYLLYFVSLRFIQKGWLRLPHLWRIILGVGVILVFAYPAFSYDLFNYMFTAKTVLVYHKNPYEVTPLQFWGIEPWINFMRWTHLPSAYTPLWILLTLPAYLLGFGYFLLIMWNTKLLVAGSYLAGVWLIGKILNKGSDQKGYQGLTPTLGMAVFALNPLVIIESLVSGHNDVLMMTLALAAMYIGLLKGSNLKLFSGLTPRLTSWFILSLSIATKLMTIFLIPVYFLGWNRVAGLVAMTVGFTLVLFQREVLPWYWVWIMPFVALLPRSTNLLILASGASLGLLLRYAPFIYLGHWNDPVPTIKFWITAMPIFLSMTIIFIYRYMKRHL